MDARQLRYFLAVVDHEGFNRAAEQLYIAQPSLSQSIAGLERELGVLLFHRVGRGVVLSDAGKQLIGPARQVLRALDVAQSTIDAVKGVTSGRVDIITMPSPGIEPLSTILAAFAKTYPEITANIGAAFVPEEVLQAVRTGASEIGILGAPTPIQAADLDVIALEKQELVLITAPSGPLSGRSSITASDLAGHRLIASQPGSLMRQMVDDVLSQGIGAKLVAEVAHRTSILPLILAEVGDAILPSGWITMARQAGAEILHITPTAYLHVAVVTRQTQINPAATALLATINRHYSQPA